MGHVVFVWILKMTRTAITGIFALKVMVVFEQIADAPLTVYPITAYEVPPPALKRRRKKR
jgi:hypothetical protein